MLFGNKIKELRETYGLLQRQLAAQLAIDTPMYSKFERGERLPKKEQIEVIAKILNSNEKELRILWLADKLLKVVIEERDIRCEAVEVAHSQLKSLLINEIDKSKRYEPITDSGS